MSLEEALNRNSEAVEKQNSLLEKMLAKAGGAPGKTEDGGEGEGDKPKTRATKGKTTKAKDTDETGEGEGDGPSHDDVKKLAGAWLGEFKANENDPETEARRAAIKKALAKVVGKEGAQVADVPADQLHRVVTWLEKQKANGRLTPEPSDEGEGGDDNDI